MATSPYHASRYVPAYDASGNDGFAFASRAATCFCMPLAFDALALAAIYAALSWFVFRRGANRVLGDAYALLAVGFATLSVPLALSARATAGVFALEGAALA